MRKINYKLNIAMIGKEVIGYQLFLNYLNAIVIDKREGVLDNSVFQIIYRHIPIKIHVKFFETINVMLTELDSSNNYDFLFLLFSIYDDDSFNNYEKGSYDELRSEINFRGSSLLIALDVNSIKNDFSIDKVRISRHRLIRKCNELDLEYCFEISNSEEDLNELFKKILDESIIKFKISNPELYEKVKEFGTYLS
jgi:hypothetical protein